MDSALMRASCRLLLTRLDAIELVGLRFHQILVRHVLLLVGEMQSIYFLCRDSLKH